MEIWIIVILISVALALAIALARLQTPYRSANWWRAGPRGEIMLTLFWRLSRVYTRLVHRVTYEGLEHVPDTNTPRPMIIVSNHTSPLDPVLIQTACPFHIRWMMAEEYSSKETSWFWDWIGIILVRRDGRDSVAVRTALRHLKSGGALGVFPEGGIEDPPSEIRPFMDGLTMFIARSGAPVLLVWVRDTPKAGTLVGTFLQPSRSKVTFLGQYAFADMDDPDTIADKLRCTLADASGWPCNNTPLPTARRHPGQASHRVD